MSLHSSEDIEYEGTFTPVPLPPPFQCSGFQSLYRLSAVHQGLTSLRCGKYCNGPQDYSSGKSNDDCLCSIRSAQDARTLGLDVVVPVPVCLVTQALQSSTSMGWLGGRDVLRNVDEHGITHQCPCNASIISDG